MEVRGGVGEGAGVTFAAALPLLAASVKQRLLASGRPELAGQIDSLPLLERCRCGDDFCCTVYTSRAKSADGFDLDVGDGMLIIHTSEDDQIVEIEALFYDVFKRELDAAMPLHNRRRRAGDKPK